MKTTVMASIKSFLATVKELCTYMADSSLCDKVDLYLMYSGICLLLKPGWEKICSKTPIPTLSKENIPTRYGKFFLTW